MANINRDYLVIADLKSGKITSPSMSFYNTDKNIANLFVKLQITMSTNPSITGFVNKEEASNYNVKLTVIKPKTTMLVDLVGIVQDESVMGNGAVYLFDMPQNFTDQVGKYVCELEITCVVNGREEVVTCDPFEYTVKESAVTGLNIEIEPNPDVPVLKQLIDEVRYLQQNGGSIVNLSKYQKLEDERLNTIDKTVVGGINELNDSKVDKVEGKGLSTVDFTTEKDTKLSGIEEGANNYIHPENHEPSIIIQDNEHRFVTDIEKETWDNKLSEHQDISHLAVKSEVDESLSQINQSNIERDKKISSIENINSVQNAKLDTLFNSTSGEMELESNTNNIKLDSSKKGTATVNYIKGNTLVNCAKENKELILNDEINVEGTYCTINDTVEGGLVDVELEGNTLINLATKTTGNLNSSDWQKREHVLNIPYALIENKTFTLICDVSNCVNSPALKICYRKEDDTIDYGEGVITNSLVNGRYIKKFTKNFKVSEVIIYLDQTSSDIINTADIKVVLLEGDYTNKPIPTESFTGIKSVGDLEELSITSNNKNLLKVNVADFESVGIKCTRNEDKIVLNGTATEKLTIRLNTSEYIGADNPLNLKPNTMYTLSTNYNKGRCNIMQLETFNIAMSKPGTSLSVSSELPPNAYNNLFAYIIIEKDTTFNNDEFWFMLEQSPTFTSYVPSISNKKQLLILNSQGVYEKVVLRGIGDTKDRAVKREGKLYVERKYKEVVLNGGENEIWVLKGDQSKCVEIYLPNVDNNTTNSLCDTLPKNEQGIVLNTTNQDMGYRVVTNGIRIRPFNKSDITLDECVNWLKQNPTTIVYPLTTPIYEEIKGLNNEFSTYADVTHVSTNTVIPCNQKIQNTGIECMLKPSTLYSIHDIKGGSGTAKYNLGGTVSTSNKITTGVTLTDNYLRLYGKGLTSKDVEVFEGDTPQTPYFSGMLSAFEDKLITQEMVNNGLEKAENLGKYRATLKVVGKNKLNITNTYTIDMDGIRTEIIQNNIMNINGQNSEKTIDRYLFGGWDISTLNNVFVLKKGSYVLSTGLSDQGVEVFLLNKNNSIANTTSSKVFTIEKNIEITGVLVRIHKGYSFNNLQVSIQVEEGNQATQYEPYKEYKTSILLSSPLLKGDEIVVHDGRLKHWHKCKERTISNTTGTWATNSTSTTVGTYRYICGKSLPGAKNGDIRKAYMMCDKIPPMLWSDTAAYGMSKLDETLFINNKYCPTLNLFNQWLKANPIPVVYELAEYYYEDITPQLPRWVLDIFDNSTISIDTIIPVESKFTYTSYIPSIPAMQTNIKGLEEANVDIIATSWDTDFRVCEIEWVLEDTGLTTPSSLYNIKTGGNIMALTRFEQAKIIILGDAYYRPTFQKQLETYLKRNYLTQEEFDTLISMMDAKEAVKGEIV